MLSRRQRVRCTSILLLLRRWRRTRRWRARRWRCTSTIQNISNGSVIKKKKCMQNTFWLNSKNETIIFYPRKDWKIRGPDWLALANHDVALELPPLLLLLLDETLGPGTDELLLLLPAPLTLVSAPCTSNINQHRKSNTNNPQLI